MTEALATFLKERVRKKAEKQEKSAVLLLCRVGDREESFPLRRWVTYKHHGGLFLLHVFISAAHKHGCRAHSSAHEYTRNPLGRMHKYAYLCCSCRYYTNIHRARRAAACVCLCV